MSTRNKKAPAKKSKVLDARGVTKVLMSSVSGPNDPVEKLLRMYIDDYISKNKAAKTVAAGLRVLGIGFRPMIDHMTFRAVDIDRRAKEFLKCGYREDKQIGAMRYENWWAKVFRKQGYPTIFIDQAFTGSRGKKCVIPEWVRTFGDKTLHHVAILVDDIEQAIFYLEKQGIQFMDRIIGERGTDLRQIFTAPEVVEGQVFSTLELIERHRGYCGFLSPKAYGKMKFIHIAAY